MKYFFTTLVVVTMKNFKHIFTKIVKNASLLEISIQGNSHITIMPVHIRE